MICYKPLTDLEFVYGTLKKGYSNHVLLKEAKFICDGYACGTRMLDLGSFPAFIEGNFENRGEVYEVSPDILSFLDRLEGHPHFYERKKIFINQLEENWFGME